MLFLVPIKFSFETNTIPDQWKCAKVIPKHKKGSKSHCNNYRPISILNILSKIIERHVHDNLYNYLVRNALLSSSQSGFRKTYSCESSLLNMVNDWFLAMDE